MWLKTKNSILTDKIIAAGEVFAIADEEGRRLIDLGAADETVPPELPPDEVTSKAQKTKGGK